MAPRKNPIDIHLSGFSGEQLESLQHLRDSLRELLPDAEECIAWGMPTYRVGGKNVAHFTGFRNHCSFFPSSGSIASQVDGIPDWCEVSKGTIRFPIGKKLPKTLVRRLVRARLTEIAATGK